MSFSIDLSLPEDTAKEVGSVFEVVLTLIGKSGIHSYAESLAIERGFFRTHRRRYRKNNP